MFDLRNPVASAKITTDFICPGSYRIRVAASSLVSQRMRLFFGTGHLMFGALAIHRHSLAAHRSNARMKAKCVASQFISFEVQSPEADSAFVIIQAFLVLLFVKSANARFIERSRLKLPHLINSPCFSFQLIIELLRLPFVRCPKRASNSAPTRRNEVAVPRTGTLFD